MSGGTVAEPGKDLGVACDAAMQSLVFDPLGMSETHLRYDAGAVRKFASRTTQTWMVLYVEPQ